LTLHLEGHGREELFDDADLSRTVGWFTTIFPVVLELASEQGDMASAIKQVKEQLRAIPQRGIGYGMLRHLREQDGAREPIRGASPAIVFNYLGQFDQALPAGAPVGPAPESAGPMQSPRGRRLHAIDVSGGVRGGQLQMVWIYSPSLHARESI